MARPTPLSEDELVILLNDVPMWRRDGATIVREMSCSDFAAAIGMVNAVAIHAEKMDHHPDILVYGWNKLRITLSTHDQGALTVLDVRLAKIIDSISTSTLAH